MTTSEITPISINDIDISIMLSDLKKVKMFQ